MTHDRVLEIFALDYDEDGDGDLHCYPVDPEPVDAAAPPEETGGEQDG